MADGLYRHGVFKQSGYILYMVQYRSVGAVWIITFSLGSEKCPLKRVLLGYWLKMVGQLFNIYNEWSC